MSDTFTGWSGPGPDADQNITIPTDSLNYEGALYEDSPFSDIPIVGPIIDWIEAQLTVLYNWLVSMFQGVINGISSVFTTVLNAVISPVATAVNWIKDKVLDVYHWLTSTIPAAIEYLRVKLVDVWSWVTSSIPAALDWIKTKLSDVWSWVTTTIAVALDWLKQKLSDTWSFITTTVSAALTWLRQTLSIVWTWISTEIPRYFDWIGTQFLNIITTLTALFSDVIKWIEANIADPTLDAIKSFVDRFFNFTKWIPDILETILTWLIESITAPHSPGILDFFNSILDWFKKYLYNPASTVEKVAWAVAGPIVGAFKLVGGLFETVFNDFMHAFVAYVKGLGPQKPEDAMINFANVAQIGRSALLGLTGLTAAGELVKFFGHLGLGHIAAMIYDMTSYREITGGMMRAFSTAVIALPATHYFNELLRPRLPSVRDVSEMFNREIITTDEYSKFLAYEGIPDYWHPHLARITETPIRYFTLAAIAKAGFFDTSFFEAELIRGGYAPDSRKRLMSMFQVTYSETIKGMMSGTAVKRFKEGMTTEAQFGEELIILGYTDQQVPAYLAAAKLEYAYDYLTDLIAAYRDAVRKGNISLDGYRDALLTLGIVPDKVEAYVLRERARLKPTEKLTPLSPAKPTYETDAGKIQVDTLRRQRRKLTITRDQQIAGLQQLGMPVDYATALADNDDIRLAEKATTE